MIKIIEAKALELGILVSGRGSNFEALHEAILRGDLKANIALLISDNEKALALSKAAAKGIKAIYINPKKYQNKTAYEEEILAYLQSYNIDLVVLAGYMRILGPSVLEAYPHRVLNIHPSLLPSFPGLEAQKQALDYGVKYSGCTVHLVDEGLDSGPIIKQAVVELREGDDLESLSLRILEQEHKSYWQAIQYMAEGRVFLQGRKIIVAEK